MLIVNEWRLLLGWRWRRVTLPDAPRAATALSVDESRRYGWWWGDLAAGLILVSYAARQARAILDLASLLRLRVSSGSRSPKYQADGAGDSEAECCAAEYV